MRPERCSEPETSRCYIRAMKLSRGRLLTSTGPVLVAFFVHTAIPAASFSGDLNAPQVAVNNALRLIEEGKKSKALQALDAVLTKYPGYPNALVAKGELLLSLGDYREALVSCDAA